MHTYQPWSQTRVDQQKQLEALFPKLAREAQKSIQKPLIADTKAKMRKPCAHSGCFSPHAKGSAYCFEHIGEEEYK